MLQYYSSHDTKKGHGEENARTNQYQVFLVDYISLKYMENNLH